MQNFGANILNYGALENSEYMYNNSTFCENLIHGSQEVHCRHVSVTAISELSLNLWTN